MIDVSKDKELILYISATGERLCKMSITNGNHKSTIPNVLGNKILMLTKEDYMKLKYRNDNNVYWKK